MSIHEERIDADGFVVNNRYYWTLSDEYLRGYYSVIVKSINLPILLYNFHNLTGQGLIADLVLVFAENHKNIVSIKDTVDSVGHIREMIIKL